MASTHRGGDAGGEPPDQQLSRQEMLAVFERVSGRAMGSPTASRELTLQQRQANVPMAYKGSATDVAYAALFFASDESRYVSGACLPVDGAVLAAR